MTKSICKTCSGQHSGNKWLPRAIDSYRGEILARFDGEPINHEHELYPVFSNVAYNLQYLEFLNKCFEDLYTTSVIRAESVKMFTLNVSQIIECMLYVKLISMNVNKDDIWDFNHNLSMANHKNAFGLGPQFYRNELRWLKDLRNRVHIQSPAKIAEADYAVFADLEVLNKAKAILRHFLQKSLSMPTKELDEVFYFLLPTKEFVHSKEPYVAKQ
jgi:hypothetical protein